MDIKMIKDPEGRIYLCQEDLLDIFRERLKRFPTEIAELKKPREGSIMGLDGKPNVIPSNPLDVAKQEGMQYMLQGIFDMLSVEE